MLSNAIKFTPVKGRIDVRVSSTAKTSEITIRDNGKGIPRDFLPHIFEHFRQADSSFTRAEGGLGLGLAIVHHLVELHGGTVKAESAGEGKGTTITITLPLAVERTDAPAPIKPPSRHRSSKGCVFWQWMTMRIRSVYWNTCCGSTAQPSLRLIPRMRRLKL